MITQKNMTNFNKAMKANNSNLIQITKNQIKTTKISKIYNFIKVRIKQEVKHKYYLEIQLINSCN